MTAVGSSSNLTENSTDNPPGESTRDNAENPGDGQNDEYDCGTCLCDFCEGVLSILWLFTRLFFTFSAAEAAVVALVVGLNLVLQMIFGIVLPGGHSIPEGVDTSLIAAASFFFLLFFLPPLLLDMLPMIVKFVLDTWDTNDLIRFRIACRYILCGKDEEKTKDEKIETDRKETDKCNCSCPYELFLIRGFKILLVAVAILWWLICLLTSGIISAIQRMFVVGLYVQLIVLALWSLVIMIIARYGAWYRGDLKFYHKSEDRCPCPIGSTFANLEHKIKSGLCWLTAAALVVALILLIIGMIQTKTGGGWIALAVLVLSFGGIHTMLIFFYNIELNKDCNQEYLASVLGQPTTAHKYQCVWKIAQFIILAIVALIVCVLVVHGTAGQLYSSTDVCEVVPSKKEKRSSSSDFLPDVCNLEWNNIDITTLAVFAQAAYQKDSTQTSNAKTDPCGVGVKEFLDMNLPDKEWQVVESAKENLVVFYELYNRKRELTIITIRGTQTIADWLQDFDFWSESALFQLFSFVIPMASILPDSTFEFLVEIASLTEWGTNAPGRRYINALDKYITESLTKPHFMDTNKVLITGHSLGGGLSKMAGSKHNIRAFSFNGPGIVYSKGKIDVNSDQINKAVVNVVLQGDVVSQVDRLGGSIHRLNCADNSPGSCHSIKTIVKELNNQCYKS